MTEEKAKSLFSEVEIEKLCGIAYIKAKHNAYFDNGFRAGINVAYGKIKPEIEQLKADKEELVEVLKECLEGVEELNAEYQEGWDSTIEQAKQLIEKHGK